MANIIFDHLYYNVKISSGCGWNHYKVVDCYDSGKVEIDIFMKEHSRITGKKFTSDDGVNFASPDGDEVMWQICPRGD